MLNRSLDYPSHAKRILITSDLHISLPEDPLYKNFIRFLRENFPDSNLENFTQELWLLGDIFDLMVGPYDFWQTAYMDFFLEIRRLTKNGTRVLWIQGNHDFFIEDLESKLPVGIFIRDEFITVDVLNFGKCFLAHGDLVDLEDRKYQRWRAFTRNPFFRTALTCVPSSCAQNQLRALGQKLSLRSRKKSRNWESNSDFVNSNKKLFRNYAREKWTTGFKGVFLGHNHIQDEYKEGNHFYFNCGSALEFGDGRFTYLDWDASKQLLPNPKVFG